MPIDRQRLLEITAAANSPQSGVAALVHGIHREPALREKVTLETFALPPVPTARAGKWVLLSLLTTASGDVAGQPTWRAPWAAVEWESGRPEPRRFLLLKEREETAPLMEEAPVYPARPADFKATLQPLERARRERALYRLLDALTSAEPAGRTDLSGLAGHYAGLLPLAVYPYYWALTPDCHEWLRPDVPSPLTT